MIIWAWYFSFPVWNFYTSFCHRYCCMYLLLSMCIQFGLKVVSSITRRFQRIFQGYKNWFLLKKCVSATSLPTFRIVTYFIQFFVLKVILRRKVGFPYSSVAKESACNAGDPGSIPGLGRSTGERIGYPLQ